MTRRNRLFMLLVAGIIGLVFELSSTIDLYADCSITDSSLSSCRIDENYIIPDCCYNHSYFFYKKRVRS